MTTTFRDRMKQAKLPVGTVPICLRGDLIAELEDLDRTFEDLPAEDDRLTSGAARRRLTEQAQAIRKEMAAGTEIFKLRGLGSRRWDELIKAHPPVPGVNEHEQVGYNTDTFFDALVRRSVFEPEMADEADWEAFLEVVTPRQWRALVTKAQELNLRDVDIPFSLAASQLMTGSEPE